jgi:ABC-2 type transport system permease protein
MLANVWRQIRAGSMIRPLTILAASLILFGFVFVVSLLGFRFLIVANNLPPTGPILELLVGLLFFSLGFFLVFSSGLILHASLFSAAEATFLLALPVRADRVFAYKFQGAVGFSSWAFVLLGSPILIAYGIVAGCPWYFYLLLPMYFFGYVLLPGSVGAIVCLVVVNFVPKRRRQFLFLSIAALVGVAGWYLWRTILEGRSGGNTHEADGETANAILVRISFARSLWLPSGWVSRGILAAARGDVASTAWYLGLVWSNGLFFYLVAAALSTRLYRRGFNRIATGGDLRRRHGGAWLDRLLGRLLPFVHPGTRLLIVKDFRTFRRDPQQWGQVAVFSGLLFLYFSNIRRMFVLDIGWGYQNGISLLNLCVIALLLSVYTGRFIYPLLSLEGRKFWILGLLPIRREQLLWGKFAFSTMGGLFLSTTLMLLNDIMLDMPVEIIVLHQLTVVVLAAGLSGLAVGLGACMPNFRESDPSKIAAGFGGTLNLVLGLGFLMCTILLMALPWHGFMLGSTPAEPASLLRIGVVLIGTALGIVGGFAAVFFPLRAGIRALNRMEF